VLVVFITRVVAIAIDVSNHNYDNLNNYIHVSLTCALCCQLTTLQMCTSKCFICVSDGVLLTKC